MYEQLSYIFPEIWLIVAICMVLLVSLFTNIDSRWPALLAKIALVVAILPVLDSYEYSTQIIFSNLYIIDKMSTVLKLAILMVGLTAFVYSRNYVLMRRLLESEYYVLGLFSILGMMVVTSANSLLIVYLGIELMSLPLYAMVALQRDRYAGTEASVKYFVMGAVASGLMLYGISLIYGITGQIDLMQINQALTHLDATTNNLVLFALMFILAGILFKLAAVPFHMWAPDIYQGAPTSVSMLIASAPKIAGLAILIRLIANGFLPVLPQIQSILAIVAVLSMGIGNLIAIAQTNMKRMLGYSAIAHSGYLLLGIIPGTHYGFSAAMFYVIVYALSTVLTFGGLILLSHYDADIETIDDLKGLGQRSPWFAFMMMLSLFSMAGVPPTAGFFAKMIVLRALVLEGWIILAVLALILSIIGCFYYLRIIRLMYFEKPADYNMPVMSLDSKIVFSINGFMILLIGTMPSYLWVYCQHVF